MKLDQRAPIILPGRYRKPQLPVDLVTRQRLFDQLDQVYQHPFTLVCAPAGYGKSTLLSNWLENAPVPYAWLSLTEEMNDFYVFLSYLLQALHDGSPNSFPQFETLLDSAQNPPDDLYLTVFCDELYERRKVLVVVLDDFHFIREARVCRFIEALVENAPTGFHLVLSARWDPGLPISRWLSRGQMAALRSEQLRFLPDEIQAFLSNSDPLSLSKQTVEALNRRSEGWIVSLRLWKYAIRAADDPEQAAHSISDQNSPLLSSYLFEQVLIDQPEHIRKFLIQTSILDSFCAELCDSLALGIPAPCNSRAILDDLQQANLFLIPQDEQGNWYRYHHLFKDALYLLLKKAASQTEINDLHREAGAWFYQVGEVDQAIQHYLAGGDPAGAALLVEHQLADLMNREDRRALERWLDLMPEVLFERRPLLLLARITQLHFKFRLAAIPALLARVEKLLEQEAARLEEGSKALAHGLVQMYRSQDAFWRNDWEGAIQHAEAGLERLLESHYFARGLCQFYRGLGWLMSGKPHEASDWLEKEINRASKPFDSRVVRLAMTLGAIYTHTGQLARAEQIGKYLLENSTNHHLLIGVAWAHYLIGRTALLQGDVDQALEHFKSVAEAPYQAHVQTAHECFLGLAAVYQAKGVQQLADRALDSAEAMAIAMENPSNLLEVRSFRARLAVQRNQPAVATSFLQSVEEETLPWLPFILLELPRLTLAKVWIASGEARQTARALALLESLLAIAITTENRWREVDLRTVMAWAYFQLGEADQAYASLEEAANLAVRRQVLHIFYELGPQIQSMVAQFRERIEPDSGLHALVGCCPPLAEGPGDRGARARSDDLTRREIEILRLLDERMSYAQIAETLVVSPLTVKTHLRNAYQKLGVHGRKEAVALLRQLGLSKANTNPNP